MYSDNCDHGVTDYRQRSIVSLVSTPSIALSLTCSSRLLKIYESLMTCHPLMAPRPLNTRPLRTTIKGLLIPSQPDISSKSWNLHRNLFLYQTNDRSSSSAVSSRTLSRGLPLAGFMLKRLTCSTKKKRKTSPCGGGTVIRRR